MYVDTAREGDGGVRDEVRAVRGCVFRFALQELQAGCGSLGLSTSKIFPPLK